jgi:hypothetical protein
MNSYEEAVITNPEDLLADGLTANEVLGGGIDTAELAKQLDQASVAAITEVLVSHQKHLSKYLGRHMSKLIAKKVWDATPEQLEDIIQEAKASGDDVWNEVRKIVQRRNDLIASQVAGYTNLDALDALLTSVAKQDGRWLPRPVYDAAKKVVSSMVADANMTTLDKIGDFAAKWRFSHEINQALRNRDGHLVRAVDRYKTLIGYTLRSGSRQMAVENARKAIRMVESGYAEWLDTNGERK